MADRTTREPGRQACNRRLRFLVLDDEAAIAQLVTRALVTCGMTGEGFTDPAVFVAETARCAPELIVLDLSLGGTDACAVMRQLAALGYGGKVLLMSGWLDAALRESEQIGASCGLSVLEPLPKPFRLYDLYRRVATLQHSCPECRSPA